MRRRRIPIEVRESLEELQALQRRHKDRLMRARVEALILVLNDKCVNYTDLSENIGYSRRAIARWFEDYRTKGLTALLHREPAGRGRVSQLDSQLGPAGLAKLKAWLEDGKNAPASYKDVYLWLKENYSITLAYNTIHTQVRKRFKAGLKVSRKSNVQKDEAKVEAFKKTPGNISKTS